jgi:hypothetical protein
MRRSPSSRAPVVAVAAAVALGACGAAPPPAAPRSCPPELAIAGQDDVAGAASCRAARAVTIKTGAPLDLAPLGELATITGDLTIGPSVGLTEVSLGGLRAVGGAIRVASNGDLHGLFLPRLERAGRLEIEANAALATLSVPRLAEVTGAVAIRGNPDLELLDASALVAVGAELAIAGNAKLVLIEAARLERAAAVHVENNALLPEDLAIALRKVAR